MSDETQTDLQAVLDAGTELAAPHSLQPVEGRAVAWMVPAGAHVEVDDLERLQDHPNRMRGTVEPITAESFVAYVNRHANEQSTVWWDEVAGTVEAVLNDHAGAEHFAGWADHRAVLRLRSTPEWDFWTKMDGVLVSQEQFAEHIEDGARELVEPDAATMLEVAQTFHATTQVQFRQATRLQSGTAQFVYDEEQQAKAGKAGSLSVPTEFVIALSPYIGEAPYRVTARLRYRVRSGGLAIGYKLDRPDRVRRDAVSQIAERMAGGLSDQVQIFAGRPKAPLVQMGMASLQFPPQ